MKIKLFKKPNKKQEDVKEKENRALTRQIINNHMKAMEQQWNEEDRRARIKIQTEQNNNEDRSEYRW